MHRIQIIAIFLITSLFSAEQAIAYGGLKRMTAGVASWYGKKFHGRKTASGATYNMHDFTCAHRTLPFGTKLLIYNPANEKACVVVVNDRGPFVGKRIIDLSKVAAGKLGIKGIGRVVCYSAKGLAKGMHDGLNIAKNAVNDEVKSNKLIAAETQDGLDIKQQQQDPEKPSVLEIEKPSVPEIEEPSVIEIDSDYE